MPELTVSEEPGGNIIVTEVSEADVVVVSEPSGGVVVTSDALPGPSAYQVALQNGFVGTEDEWLASLRPSGFNRQIPFGGIRVAEIKEYEGRLPLAEDGTLREVWVVADVAPVGAPLTLQLKLNGADFGPPVSVLAGTNQIVAGPLANTYSSGDLLGISFTSVGTQPAEGVTVLVILEDV